MKKYTTHTLRQISKELWNLSPDSRGRVTQQLDNAQLYLDTMNQAEKNYNEAVNQAQHELKKARKI